MKPRIVSLAPSATAILCALGAKAHLVGVTHWCKDVAPVNSLPTFGDCWRSDPTAVAALEPDLVIGSVPYQAATVKGLLDKNLTLLAKSPRSLRDIFRDIQLLGLLVAREKRAERLLADMKSEIDKVERLTRRLRRRPRVYCEAWPKPRMASPVWAKELVEIAGGRFVPPGPGRIVAEKEILRSKPEVVVLAWAGCGMQANGKKVMSRAGWRHLPAIRNRRVYVISDELLNTPAPTLVTGLRYLAGIIHPEIFGPPSTEKLVRLAGKEA